MQPRKHLLHHESAAYEPQHHNHLCRISPEFPFCSTDVIICGPPYAYYLPGCDSQNNTVNRYINIKTMQSAKQELVRIFVKKKLKNNTQNYVINPITYSKGIFPLPVLCEIISASIYWLINIMGAFFFHAQISGNLQAAFLPHNFINLLRIILSSFQLHLQHLILMDRKAARLNIQSICLQDLRL